MEKFGALPGMSRGKFGYFMPPDLLIQNRGGPAWIYF
jgi:hypothetical protein